MTTCAALIVRNNAGCLGRCLQSLTPLVDEIAVIDTGSTDDTPALAAAAGCHLEHRPWVDSGHNRTELLAWARQFGDYLLLIDADQSAAGRLPEVLDADCYDLRVYHGSIVFRKPLLIAAHLQWLYRGKVHEYLTQSTPHAPREESGPHAEREEYSRVPLNTLTITEHLDQGVDGTKPRWLEDAEILERELISDPENSRNVFYLARTYEDLQSTRPTDVQAHHWRHEAISRYRQRVTMGGYGEELFYAHYKLGCLQPDGDRDLLRAWELRPDRLEPVYEICYRLRDKQLFRASYALSTSAGGNKVVLPPEGLFVSVPVHCYLMLFEHSISAYYVGAFEECRRCCDVLAAMRDVPPHIAEQVKRNRDFAVAALGK